MARQAFFSFVSVPQKRLHGVTVRSENAAIVRICERIERQPKDVVHSVFDAHTPNRYPLRWGRQFGRVVVVKLLRKIESTFAKSDKQLVLIN